ncbi:hypothetical protein DL93DRAFT_2157212 [Clavulina sp. PMI_390]|nr:hypothetical protein DL93DRAFT_2157212 [Clavulina sp. PMI_390]
MISKALRIALVALPLGVSVGWPGLAIGGVRAASLATQPPPELMRVNDDASSRGNEQRSTMHTPQDYADPASAQQAGGMVGAPSDKPHPGSKPSTAEFSGTMKHRRIVIVPPSASSASQSQCSVGAFECPSMTEQGGLLAMFTTLLECSTSQDGKLQCVYGDASGSGKIDSVLGGASGQGSGEMYPQVPATDVCTYDPSNGSLEAATSTACKPYAIARSSSTSSDKRYYIPSHPYPPPHPDPGPDHHEYARSNRGRGHRHEHEHKHKHEHHNRDYDAGPFARLGYMSVKRLVRMSPTPNMDVNVDGLSDMNGAPSPFSVNNDIGRGATALGVLHGTLVKKEEGDANSTSSDPQPDSPPADGGGGNSTANQANSTSVYHGVDYK